MHCECFSDDVQWQNSLELRLEYKVVAHLVALQNEALRQMVKVVLHTAEVRIKEITNHQNSMHPFPCISSSDAGTLCCPSSHHRFLPTALAMREKVKQTPPNTTIPIANKGFQDSQANCERWTLWKLSAVWCQLLLRKQK